jgi:hypothetical protein
VTRLGRRRKRVKRTRASVCGDKIRHATREEAIQARRQLIAREGVAPNGVQAYKCPFGNHFHVGRGVRNDARNRQ